MATIAQLNEQYGTLVESVRQRQAVVEAADAPSDAELSAVTEALEAAEAMRSQIEARQANANRLAALESAVTRSGQPIPVGGPPLPTTDPANRSHPYSIAKCIRYQLGACRLDGIEGETHAELVRQRGSAPEGVLIPHTATFSPVEEAARRSLDTSTAAAFTSQANRLPIIQAFRSAMVLDSLGVSTIAANQKFALPKAGKATVYYVDGGSPTASDPTPSNVMFDLRTLAAKTKALRKLLLSSDVGVIDYVMTTLVADLALGIQEGVLNGPNTGGAPKGLFRRDFVTDGVKVKAMGTNGLAIAFADLVAMTGDVAGSNAPGAAKWLMSSKLASKLETTVKVTGQPVYCYDPATNQTVGRPTVITNSVPDNLTKGSASGICSALAFGVWQYAVLALFSGIDLYVNPYTDDGGVTISAFQDFDFNITKPEAFTTCVDILA